MTIMTTQYREDTLTAKSMTTDKLGSEVESLLKDELVAEWVPIEVRIFHPTGKVLEVTATLSHTSADPDNSALRLHVCLPDD